MNRVGPSEYTCDCEEFSACYICRHSLAVAKVENDGKEFIESLADKVKVFLTVNNNKPMA